MVVRYIKSRGEVLPISRMCHEMKTSGVEIATTKAMAKV
jgi:hypothetical protein